jgi:hypothetical protein
VSDEECCVWTKKIFCNFKNNVSCNQPTKMTTNKKVLMSLKLNLKPKKTFSSQRQRKFLCVTKKKYSEIFFFGKNSSDYLEREKIKKTSISISTWNLENWSKFFPHCFFLIDQKIEKIEEKLIFDSFSQVILINWYFRSHLLSIYQFNLSRGQCNTTFNLI